MMYYMYGPWMYFGWLWAIIFWVLIILAVAWLFSRRDRHHVSESNAVETLKLRYAKGEITKKEFDEMKKDIEK